MKKKCFLCLWFFLFLGFCISAAPSIAVIDFDSGSFCTMEEAAVMTDAFRNEMVRSGKADIVTRNRLDALKSEIRFQMSDWVDPSKVKQAGRMIGADYMIFGRFGIMGSNGNLQVEMVDVETARILYSSRMTLAVWREFDYKVGAFAKEFINKIPSENIFSGAWTADVLHDGVIDSYTITFTGSNRCAVKVTSLINGQEITEEGQGTYSFDGDILKITAVLRNSRIPHINSIQWSSVISISDRNSSFNMLVKPTSASNNQVRVTFTKE
jgi:TolB-like protein